MVSKEKYGDEIREACQAIEEPYGDHGVVAAWYAEAGDSGGDLLRAFCRRCGTDVAHEILTADMYQEARWVREKLKRNPSSCEEARRLNLVREVMES